MISLVVHNARENTTRTRRLRRYKEFEISLICYVISYVIYGIYMFSSNTFITCTHLWACVPVLHLFINWKFVVARLCVVIVIGSKLVHLWIGYLYYCH